MDSTQNHMILTNAFLAAIDSVKPRHFMKDALEKLSHIDVKGAIYLIAFGKAAGEMCAEFMHAGGHFDKALVVVPHNVDIHFDAPSITLCHSAHPVPDKASCQAAERALALAGELTKDDLLIVLISGGGSSLVCAPPQDISLNDKMLINEALLASGAPIQEMNIVRRHLSVFKGGRLAAAAAPAKLVAFALSDVPGDDPAAIASGPTVGDVSTKEDALAILERYQIQLPSAVSHWLHNDKCESPFPDDALFINNEMHIIGSASIALQAAADSVAQAGYHPVILGDGFQIDSTEMANYLIKEIDKMPAGTALISGGETSVEVKGTGCGGRNAECAHALALYDRDDLCGLMGDSDGIDGGAPVAASLFFPGQIEKAKQMGLDAQQMLDNNDSHSFFEHLNCQLITGPTQTNVNDIRILLKGAPQS